MPVPLNPDKYRSPSVFEPQDFLSYMQKSGHITEAEKAPDAAILCYQKSLFDFVVDKHRVRFHTGYFKQHLAYLEDPENPASGSPSSGNSASERRRPPSCSRSS